MDNSLSSIEPNECYVIANQHLHELSKIEASKIKDSIYAVNVQGSSIWDTNDDSWKI